MIYITVVFDYFQLRDEAFFQDHFTKNLGTHNPKLLKKKSAYEVKASDQIWPIFSHATELSCQDRQICELIG